MGIASNGIYGPIRGKVGQVVWYVVNGRGVARGIGDRTAPRTKNEIQSSNRQNVLIDLFGRIKFFIKKGFLGAAEGTFQNYHNLAVSYNRKNAINPDKTKTDILFDKLLLTQGNLLMPLNPSVLKRAEGLEIKWDFKSSERHDDRTDRVMLLAYFPNIKAQVSELSGARREKMQELLPISPELLEETMHVYIAFCAEIGNDVSNSVYLGQIN